jgi:hypothetical protein
MSDRVMQFIVQYRTINDERGKRRSFTPPNKCLLELSWIETASASQYCRNYIIYATPYRSSRTIRLDLCRIY